MYVCMYTDIDLIMINVFIMFIMHYYYYHDYCSYYYHCYHYVFQLLRGGVSAALAGALPASPSPGVGFSSRGLVASAAPRGLGRLGDPLLARVLYGAGVHQVRTFFRGVVCARAWA